MWLNPAYIILSGRARYKSVHSAVIMSVQVQNQKRPIHAARCQESDIPWGGGYRGEGGGNMKEASWVLIMVGFLIWALVTWVCAVYRNSSKLTFIYNMHFCVHIILNKRSKEKLDHC